MTYDTRNYAAEYTFKVRVYNCKPPSSTPSENYIDTSNTKVTQLEISLEPYILNVPQCGIIILSESTSSSFVSSKLSNTQTVLNFTELSNYPLGSLSVTIKAQLTGSPSTPAYYTVNFIINVLNCKNEPFTFTGMPAVVLKNLRFPLV